jgi:4-amino-4-deoxy-L-arabinose transferase-like glycosyltransferase
MTERVQKVLILTILGISLVVRLGAVARIENPQNVPRSINESDAPTYYRLAHSLLDGTGYRYSADSPPTARRTPGYPIFLATIFKIFGRNFHAVRVAQSILDTISTYLVYIIGMLLFRNRPAGVLASLAYAVYLPAVIVTTYIMTENLYTFLLLAFVATCLLAMKARRYVLFSASGIFLGLAILTRPVLLPLPFVLLVIAVIWRRSLWKSFLVLTVAFSLTMMPWAFRNKRDMGKYIPAGTLTGTNLYKGNYLPTQGAYFLSTDSLLTDEIRTEIAQVTEVQRDSMLQAEAIKMIKSNKADTAVLALKKFPRLWLNIGYGRKPSNRSVAVAACHTLLLLFGLYGLVRSPASTRYLSIIPVTTIVLSTILYLAIAAVVRFVLPLIPLVLAYSSYGFVSMIKRE